MRTALEALVDAFFESDRTLAVVDVETRNRLGHWSVPYEIPVREIADLLRAHPLLNRGSMVIIPLHEEESAELSSEYVYLCRDNGLERIVFIDSSSRAIRRLTVPSATGTYLGWRMRFWHPAFDPPGTPSFLADRLAGDSSPPEPSAGVGGELDGIAAGDWFEELKLFVQLQRDAAREEGWKRYQSYERDYFFRSFNGVRSAAPAGRRVGSDEQQICLLELSNGGNGDVWSEHGLYPATEVLVDTRKRREGFPVEAEIVGVDGTQLELSIRWSTSKHHSAAESAFDANSGFEFSVAELVNPAPFVRQRDGVLSIEADDRKRAIVTGTGTIEFDESATSDLYTKRLNEHQRSAIRAALRSRDVFCITGPPGSGKTRTLRETVREAVEEGERVLACAPSDLSVDGLLVGSSTSGRPDPQSLHAAVHDGEFVMARVGDSPNTVVSDSYAGVEPWEANVVGATMDASHRFRTDEFDVVVVDHASRAGIPSTCIPFSKGERLVLAGDHRQLPPYHSAESADEETVHLSLFEHLLELYGDELSVLLRRQYRMNERIAAFPNVAFYDGLLTHGEQNRSWRIEDLEPLLAYQVEGEEQRMPSGSFYNEAEATVAVREVDRLLHRGVSPSRIGVITPYSGQVGKIVQFLEEEELQQSVSVSTIDGFQDGEREAIVVSFVRSNPGGHTGFLGFPTEGPRRLNVAMTRARKRCVLIGNWETLGTTPPGADPDARADHVYAELRRFLSDNDILRENPMR